MPASLSIIVPVYNTAPYLRQCLESMLAQTFSDIEIVCVNDGSTDGSADILAELAAQDARVRVIAQENAGLSAAWDAGLDAATAPLIMFCDSDDWYLPDMCEKMRSAIEDSGSDIAICNFEDEWGVWPTVPRGMRLSGKCELNDDINCRMNSHVWNKIYRREIINRYNIRFRAGRSHQDNYFVMAYLSVSHHAFFVPDKLYHYRRVEGSIVSKLISKKSPDCIDLIHVGIDLYTLLERHGLLPENRVYWATSFCELYNQAYCFAYSKENREEITGTAARFLQAHCKDTSVLPPNLAKAFEIIKMNGKKVSGCFPVRVVETPFAKKIYFMGLPLLKVKYSIEWTRYYPFGLFRLLKRKNTGNFER